MRRQQFVLLFFSLLLLGALAAPRIIQNDDEDQVIKKNAPKVEVGGANKAQTTDNGTEIAAKAIISVQATFLSFIFIFSNFIFNRHPLGDK